MNRVLNVIYIFALMLSFMANADDRQARQYSDHSWRLPDGSVLSDSQYRSEIYYKINAPLIDSTNKYLESVDKENGLHDRISGSLLRKASQDDGVVSSTLQWIFGNKPADTRSAGEVSSDEAHRELLLTQKQVQKEMDRLGLDKLTRDRMGGWITSTYSKEKDKIAEGAKKINIAIIASIAAGSAAAVTLAPVSAAVGSGSAVAYLALDSALDPKETMMDKLADQGHMVPIAGVAGALTKVDLIKKILLAGGVGLGAYNGTQRLNASDDLAKASHEARKKGNAHEADLLMEESDYQAVMAIVDASLGGLSAFGFLQTMNGPKPVGVKRAEWKAADVERVRNQVEIRAQEKIKGEVGQLSNEMKQLEAKFNSKVLEAGLGELEKSNAASNALVGKAPPECSAGASGRVNDSIANLKATVAEINKLVSHTADEMKVVVDRQHSGKCGVTDEVRMAALEKLLGEFDKTSAEIKRVYANQVKQASAPFFPREKIAALFEAYVEVSNKLQEFALTSTPNDHRLMLLADSLNRIELYSPEIQTGLVQEFAVRVKQLEVVLKTQQKCAPITELSPEELANLRAFEQSWKGLKEKVSVQEMSPGEIQTGRHSVSDVRNHLMLALESGPKFLGRALAQLKAYNVKRVEGGVKVSIYLGARNVGQSRFYFSDKGGDAEVQFTFKADVSGQDQILAAIHDPR